MNYGYGNSTNYSSYYQPNPQRNAYQMPQQTYQAQMDYMQQLQPGEIQARYVSGREEAVASNVIADGRMFIFADRAHGMLYTKQINPQTGIADFRTYQEIQPETAQSPVQYVTFEEFEQRLRELETRFAPKKNGKAAIEND